MKVAVSDELQLAYAGQRLPPRIELARAPLSEIPDPECVLRQNTISQSAHSEGKVDTRPKRHNRINYYE